MKPQHLVNPDEHYPDIDALIASAQEASGFVDNKASWISDFGRLWQYGSIERQRDRSAPPRGRHRGSSYAGTPHRPAR